MTNTESTTSDENDPLGKRALFSPPVDSAEPDDTDETAPTAQGRHALYSRPANGPPVEGITLECSGCGAHSELRAMEAAMKSVLSVWTPWTKFNRLLRCPACSELHWCRIHWRD